MLQGIMALYDLDEASAIDRLAREEVAAEQFAAILALELEHYAGAWFDADTQQLHVAVADASAFIAVEDVGASPVLVEHSLLELEQLASEMRTGLASDFTVVPLILSSSVNYRENRIEFGVPSGYAEATSARLRYRGWPESVVRVFGSDSLPSFSGDVIGAHGVRNFNWSNHPCSIGVSINGGYVTAGHCGEAGHVMHTPSGQLLGTVQASQWGSSADGAWVQTFPGWTPRPWFESAAEGILNVSAKWGGLLVAPVGATVCRHGYASAPIFADEQGPDCGTVDALDVAVDFGAFRTINGLTRATGICTNAGDSGGPYVTATGQVQGTNTGGLPGNSCPDPEAGGVWFQPIADTLSAFSKNMLTPHGAVKATANGYECPDVASSGPGSFLCKIDSYNSQGATTISWTSNVASQSPLLVYFQSCVPGAWVTVSLALTNPYGTRNMSSGFTCP